MPNPRRVPSYRFHKASGQAIVLLDGRTHYLGPWESPGSRFEYDRIVAEWLAAGLGPAPGADLSLNELVLAYWRFAESYYRKGGRPTSEVDTIRQAVRMLRKSHGHTRAVDFGPLALKAVRQAMIDHGWCRGYVNKQVDRVRRMFSWAAENELVPVVVHQALATVAGLRRGRTEARESVPVAPVAEADVERALPHMPPTIAAMVRVQLLTGMRPGEVTSIRAAEVDRSDPACWVYRPSAHKSEHRGRERVIFIGPRALAILGPFLDAAAGEGQGVGFAFDPRRAEAERRAGLRARRRVPLYPSHAARASRAKDADRPCRVPRERYDVAGYRRAIRRACLKAGIAAWHPNRIRHTAATEIRRRYGLEASQAVLGHAELGVTQVYAEADLGRARAIMSEAG